MVNRVIEFRGETFSGELVYGSLVNNVFVDDKNKHECFILVDNKLDETCDFDYLKYKKDYYEVKPQSVSQYIGLTDKNDVKLYENDLTNFGVITFAYGCFMVKQNYDNYISFSDINLSLIEKIEL